jgi:outer membrane protein OmpA-like peptidoglycan-associated protein
VARFANCILALALCLVPATATACAPDMIFFTVGSHRLGTHDLEWISGFAKQYRSRSDRSIVLYAQGDSSRATRANLRLAQLRGEAVRAALIRRGVPRADIVIRTQTDGGSVVFEFAPRTAQKTEATCGSS